MRASERRQAILALLSSEKKAVAGNVLAERFGVSRQIIVQDISALKGAGHEILSTHCGYVLHASVAAERVFKVRHSTAQTEDELGCIVGLGGTVVDVFVWHRVYGRIAAPLDIDSEQKIRQFMDGIRSGRSTELMHITDGYHYHTVRAQSEQILNKIAAELDARGYTVPELTLGREGGAS